MFYFLLALSIQYYNLVSRDGEGVQITYHYVHINNKNCIPLVLKQTNYVMVSSVGFKTN